MSLRSLNLAIFFGVIIALASTTPEDLMLGSKRPYTPLEISFETAIPKGKSAEVDDSPVHFMVVVSRHGARFPTRKKFQMVQEFLREASRVLPVDGDETSSIAALIDALEVGG